MHVQEVVGRIKSHEAKIGVMGMGYVGLPLALLALRKGFHVIGFDTDHSKVDLLMKGQSYIKHIDTSSLTDAIQGKRFYATADMHHLRECHVILICVPTPLNANREPNMQYVFQTAAAIATNMNLNTLVVLESTTYPGTTHIDVKNILHQDNGYVGRDFYLAFSPEREDPGNLTFNTQNIPKIVGGVTQECGIAATALYKELMDKVVTVSSTKVAEMAKLLENIFRSVNIALVNELKMLCNEMCIDIWEVIDAAATKPFGFMPFYPGPGLGGHCIPIDPFYLTWKAREYGMTTRFIELAGEINTSQHHYVIDKIVEALNLHGKAVMGSTILICGVAYKSNVDDIRESPAFPIMMALLDRGAHILFSDPHVPKLPVMREYEFSHDEFWNKSVCFDDIEHVDAAVIITDHKLFDYEKLMTIADTVVDTRNATKHVKTLRGKIMLA